MANVYETRMNPERFNNKEPLQFKLQVFTMLTLFLIGYKCLSYRSSLIYDWSLSDHLKLPQTSLGVTCNMFLKLQKSLP